MLKTLPPLNIMPFAETFFNAEKIVNNMKGNSFQEVQHLHNKLQQLLWDRLQCHPNFNRSVSFIFIKQLINQPMTEKEVIFSQAFQSKLKSERLYNLIKKEILKKCIMHLFMQDKRLILIL